MQTVTNCVPPRPAKNKITRVAIETGIESETGMDSLIPGVPPLPPLPPPPRSPPSTAAAASAQRQAGTVLSVTPYPLITHTPPLPQSQNLAIPFSGAVRLAHAPHVAIRWMRAKTLPPSPLRVLALPSLPTKEAPSHTRGQPPLPLSSPCLSPAPHSAHIFGPPPHPHPLSLSRFPAFGLATKRERGPIDGTPTTSKTSTPQASPSAAAGGAAPAPSARWYTRTHTHAHLATLKSLFL